MLSTHPWPVGCKFVFFLMLRPPKMFLKMPAFRAPSRLSNFILFRQLCTTKTIRTSATGTQIYDPLLIFYGLKIIS